MNVEEGLWCGGVGVVTKERVEGEWARSSWCGACKTVSVSCFSGGGEPSSDPRDGLAMPACRAFTWTQAMVLPAYNGNCPGKWNLSSVVFRSPPNSWLHTLRRAFPRC